MPKLEAMYAWVIDLPEGHNVMLKAPPAQGGYPIIGANLENMRKVEPYAKEMTRKTGRTTRLVKFVPSENVIKVKGTGIPDLPVITTPGGKVIKPC